MKAVLIGAVLIMAGCETSPVWYATHPEKTIVAVDGYDVSVVPRGAGKYDALGGDEGPATSTPILKARQIRAVEMVSRCKVSAAEFIPSTWVLQTVVACN